MPTNDTPPAPLTDEILRLRTENATLTGELAKLREHADHDAGEILRLGGELARITAENLEGGAEIRAVVEDRQRLGAELAERTHERDREASEARGYQKLAKEAAEAEKPGLLVLIVQHDGSEVRIFGSDRSAEERFGETVARWWKLLRVTGECMEADERAEKAEADRDACRADAVAWSQEVTRARLDQGSAIRDREQMRRDFEDLQRANEKAEHERDAARADAEWLAKGAARQAMADDAMESELRRQLEAAIRDRAEFAASEVERLLGDWRRDDTGRELNEFVAARAAELRKAGGGAPWPPGVVADGGVIRVQLRPEPEANGARLSPAIANAHEQASVGDVRTGLLHLIDAVRALAGDRAGGAS